MLKFLKRSDPAARFVIMGLPRSGTTYLMTLLNSHPDVHCSGEQFNPHAIVGVAERNPDLGDVTERDRDPVGFMKSFFESHRQSGVACIGFKFMIGHNIRILKEIERAGDIDVLYVYRENRLAQVSSLIKAVQSQRWAQSSHDEHVSRKIAAGPKQISHRWHEYETFDHMTQLWLKNIENRSTSIEYKEIFSREFNEKICSFLGIDYSDKMKSPLIKQSANEVAERFENPERIRDYFCKLGLERWLEAELDAPGTETPSAPS